MTLPVAGLSVLGGWLLSTALRDAEYSLVGWFSLLPLFLAIRILRPRAAMLCAAFWGASLYLCAAPAGLFHAAGAPSSFLLVAAIPALYALVGALFTRRVGFHPLLLGLGWLGVEVALAPLSMRHGLLASSQGEGPLVQVLGSAMGYAFVAVLIALINAVLLLVLSEIPAAEYREPAWKLSRGPVSWPFPEPAFAVTPHLAGPARPRGPPFRR